MTTIPYIPPNYSSGYFFTQHIEELHRSNMKSNKQSLVEDKQRLLIRIGLFG